MLRENVDPEAKMEDEVDRIAEDVVVTVAGEDLDVEDSTRALVQPRLVLESLLCCSYLLSLSHRFSSSSLVGRWGEANRHPKGRITIVQNMGG